MEFIVVEHSPQTRESLCYLLLPLGIKGIPVANRKEALEILKNKEIRGAIIDVDNREVEGLQLIEDIKGNEKTKNIHIIVHSVQSQREFVLKMVELGAVGYLLKPLNEEETTEKLKKILQKLESHRGERKHIRVKPDPEDIPRLHFRLSDYPKLISGKILDISMGGVAAELFNPPEEDILKPKTPIPSIQFTLLNKQINAEGEIVLTKANVIAIKFINMSKEDSLNLAKYIFKQIS